MVDVRNPDNVVAAIKPNTKMVWFELMSNPLLRVGDVKTIAEKVHAVNKDIVVCVDNTFLTCYNSVSQLMIINVSKVYSSDLSILELMLLCIPPQST